MPTIELGAEIYDIITVVEIPSLFGVKNERENIKLLFANISARFIESRVYRALQQVSQRIGPHPAEFVAKTEALMATVLALPNGYDILREAFGWNE